MNPTTQSRSPYWDIVKGRLTEKLSDEILLLK